MSTVETPAARRRWALVGAGVALLVAVLAGGPRVLAVAAVPPTTATPGEVVARALASADVPYVARGESRGDLALPDLRGFGDLAALLGGTTSTRVWWDGPRHWRVDAVDPAGERDTYGLATSVTTWDSGSRRLDVVVGDPSARLPRPDDLLAPQAARRLLAAVGPQDRLEALDARRVDGRTTDGVRVVPGDVRSTVERADVRVDRATGLPLHVEVVGRSGRTSLVSTLHDVAFERPDASVVTPPAPPDARRGVDRAPDLVARAATASPWLVPDALAGLTASGVDVARAPTYGSGLVRVLALPLPPRVAGEVVGDASSVGTAEERVPGGAVTRVGSGLLNAALVRDDDGQHAYVLVGLVDPALLDAMAADLLGDPPPPRTMR